MFSPPDTVYRACDIEAMVVSSISTFKNPIMPYDARTV